LFGNDVGSTAGHQNDPYLYIRALVVESCVGGSPYFFLSRISLCDQIGDHSTNVLEQAQEWVVQKIQEAIRIAARYSQNISHRKTKQPASESQK
jgi:hypothetical protein